MQKVQLIMAGIPDAKRIHEMKYRSFLPLYEKYHDDETSPVSEPLDKVLRQLRSSNTDYFLIEHDEEVVGAVRIVHDGEDSGRQFYRISPLFILPEHQNKGFGYAAMNRIFEMYPQADVWRLSTIKEEKGNCHLYEKCGFVRNGTEEKITENMTLVFYSKQTEFASSATAPNQSARHE